MDAPKRIWAWFEWDQNGDQVGWKPSHVDGPDVFAYILAAEHERIVAEKDKKIARLRQIVEDQYDSHSHMNSVAAAAAIGEFRNGYNTAIAEKDAEIARLRHKIQEASDPDFLFGAMDNVNDMDVSLADFADAASRAIRAALENAMSDSANIRLERINRLLAELEYEIVRGVMEREIEPEMHFAKVFPCHGRGDGLAALEVHLYPTKQHSNTQMRYPPRLRVVEGDRHDQ